MSGVLTRKQLAGATLGLSCPRSINILVGLSVEAGKEIVSKRSALHRREPEGLVQYLLGVFSHALRVAVSADLVTPRSEPNRAD